MRNWEISVNLLRAAATASESLTTFLDDSLIAAIASKIPRVCAVSLGRKFNFQENPACLSEPG